MVLSLYDGLMFSTKGVNMIQVKKKYLFIVELLVFVENVNKYSIF